MRKAKTMDIGGERSGHEHSRRPASGRWPQAVWLGGKEIVRSWPSYPVTGLVMLFLGLLVVPSADEIVSLEGSGQGGGGFEYGYSSFSADLLFLVFGLLLAVNWMSRDYFRVFSRDAFSERLIFMRSLPVSSGTIVGSRMISLCFALLFTVPAFFIPLYLFSELGQLGWSFVWFVLIWVGYSLLGAGLYLLAEFGIHGRTYVWMSFVFPALLIATVAFLEWAVDLRAVERLAGLAQSYGPLIALVSLIAGAIGFVMMAKAATRRIESRDLSA